MFLAAAGLMFILLLFNMVWDKELSSDEFLGVFAMLYFIIGIALTFSVFKEAHNQKSNHLYFALPISPLERLLAIWFGTTVIYTLAFSVLALIIGQFGLLFGAVILDVDYSPGALFSENYWRVLKAYLIVQPIFLFGAIAFKKNRIGKTLLFITLVVIVFAIINMMLYGLLNHSYEVFDSEPLGSEALENAQKDFSGMGKWLFMLVLGPVMLLAAYFKLLEKEV